ncbi:tyrosinase-like [Phyllobates terribilis]|uniref:tyrosinase-like n=1 Tax=Phyllobates terribilis TaxID=111132 RepID=UPI003CCA8DCB
MTQFSSLALLKLILLCPLGVFLRKLSFASLIFLELLLWLHKYSQSSPSLPTHRLTLRHHRLADSEAPEMMLLGLVLLGISSAAAMFYRECVENVSSFPVVCCPMYKGSMCGSALNRGSCLPVASSRTVSDPDVTIDDRNTFPSHYFTHTCQCKANFIGENCGQCDFNRYGDNCEYQNTVTRREIRELSEKDRHQYFAQLHQCKSKIDPDYVILVSGDRFRSKAYEFRPASYYDIWCYVHNYITRLFINNTRENSILNFGHGSTGFLTFHRMYMLQLERSMQRCTKDPNFSLLYYDWRNDPDCAICNEDFLCGNNVHGYLNDTCVFSSWRLHNQSALQPISFTTNQLHNQSALQPISFTTNQLHNQSISFITNQLHNQSISFITNQLHNQSALQSIGFTTNQLYNRSALQSHGHRTIEKKKCEKEP